MQENFMLTGYRSLRYVYLINRSNANIMRVLILMMDMLHHSV